MHTDRASIPCSMKVRERYWMICYRDRIDQSNVPLTGVKQFTPVFFSLFPITIEPITKDFLWINSLLCSGYFSKSTFSALQGPHPRASSIMKQWGVSSRKINLFKQW